MSVVERLKSLRIGYAPYSKDLQRPGDRRRFPHYARVRGLDFELADPSQVYDLVVLSARSDLVSWSRCPRSTRLVYDLIDSYLAVPESDLKAVFRGISKWAIGELRRPVGSYRQAIEGMTKRADAVVCTTLEQQQMLSAFCPNVHVILDFHTELGEARKSDFWRSETFHLVWEGLPQNLGGFLRIADVLRAVGEDHAMALHLVTDLEYHAYLDKFFRRSSSRAAKRIFDPSFIYEWNPWALARLATSSDLAVVPLDLEDPLAAGKPENKLLVFWRLGVPALVSATPAHVRAMDAAGLDMVCSDPSDWDRWLRLLIEDECARRRAGELGAAYAESEVGESSLLSKWDAVLESLW